MAFKNDFYKLLNTPWEKPAEKQFAKLFYKNKTNIDANEEQGKAYIKQVYDKNKSLIQSNCSDDFVELMDTLTGTASMVESEIKKVEKLLNSLSFKKTNYLKENTTVVDYTRDKIASLIQGYTDAHILQLQELIMPYMDITSDEPFLIKEEMLDELTNSSDEDVQIMYSVLKQQQYNNLEESTSKNKNQMYRYYKIQFLNEAAYVTVPSFLVDRVNEHKSVLGFALESAQIKTQKGVDYVVEVSPKDYEESVPSIEATYGTEAKDEKPQDASIDATKNQFDKVKEEKGATQSDPEKLHEALSNLFEAEEPWLDPKGGSNADADIDPLYEGEECLDEHSAAFDKASGGSHFAESAGGDEDDSTKHMTHKPEYSETLTEGNTKNCVKCGYANCYAIPGHYMECPKCGNHWKKLNEDTTTADINVPEVPAFGKDGKTRKDIENADPYGEGSGSEYLSDEKVLEEKFVKFVLRNCQDSKKFISEGKFNLKSYLDSKSFGFLKLLENQFIESLQENESNGEFEIDDTKFEGDQITVVYYYPSDTESRDITFSKDEFFDGLEAKDPNWEDYTKKEEFEDRTDGESYMTSGTTHDTENYWNSFNPQEQNKLLKDFLINQKGVSKTL